MPSILSDIDVTVGPHDVKACQRIGLSDKNKSKKICCGTNILGTVHIGGLF